MDTPQLSKEGSAQTKLPIIIMAIVTVLAVGYAVYNTFFNNFDKKTVSQTSSYTFGDNLSCTIKYSTTRDDIGVKLSLLNLNTDEPKLLFGDGGTSPVKKIVNDDTLLVVQLVALSGGIDTVTLEKKTGTFARTSSGSVAGIYAVAQKGNCN